MSRLNILFVAGALHQAGAERFAYEVDSALDKNRFKISILCLEEENQASDRWKGRYYESLHLDLGTDINYIDAYLNNKTYNPFERIFHKLTNNTFKKDRPKWKPNLYHFLNSFDVVHWMGEYNFIHTLPEHLSKRSLIHIMTAKFQEPDIYKAFDFNASFHFISGFKEDEIKHELSEFKNVQHTYFPLVLKIEAKENRWKFRDSQVKKIGIFTRLDRFKPLDPFLYSFQLLLDKLPNCELHIFGSGDPVKEGVVNFLERLGIKERVIFRGHQDDIIAKINKEHLDVSWFQGYNNDRPAGYAGFDVCTTGTPLICWDFFPEPTKPFNTVYPHFKNLNEFASESFKILTNKAAAEALSQTQFKDIEQSRNSKYFIHTLEETYQSIATE